MPEEEFESFVEEANRLGMEISSASLMRRACQWRGNAHSNQHDSNQPSAAGQSPAKTPPEVPGKAPESPSTGILEMIAELKGHHNAMVSLLNPARSDPLREPGDDRLLHRYLSESGELIARLEKLLS